MADEDQTQIADENDDLTGPQRGQQDLRSMLRMQDARLQGLQGAYGQGIENYRFNAGALQDLLQRTADTLRQTPVATSPAERYGLFASAAGTPTRTGAFGELMGNMGKASADILAQKRQSEFERQQLIAKYGIDAGQLGMQSSAMGLQQLAQQMNNANTRLSSLAIAQGNQNRPDKLVIIGANGQPQINPAAIQARGSLSAAEWAARIHAQMAGITDPGMQDAMMARAQRIAAYKEPPPPAPRAGNIGALAQYNTLTSMVQSLNSGYDFSTYPTKVKALNSFRSGKDAGTLDSLNTSIQHLAQLNDLRKALVNGDIQGINSAKNSIQEWFGRAPPMEVSLVQDMAAGEVNKIATGGPGAEGDRDLMRAALNIRKASPDQADKVIGDAIGLMAGRTYSMRTRFKAATKLGDADFDAQLTPETRAALERHPGGGGSASAAPSAAPEQNRPSATDVAYLKAHPEVSKQFEAHFGTAALKEAQSGR